MVKIKKKIKRRAEPQLRRAPSGEYVYDPNEQDEMNLRHQVRARLLYDIKIGLGNLIQRVDDVKRDGLLPELDATVRLLQSADFMILAGERWRTRRDTPSSTTKKKR